MVGVHGVEFAKALLLAVEELHHLHPGDVLLEIRVDASDAHAHGSERLPNLQTEHDRRDRENRHDEERHQGEAGVDEEQRHGEAQHLEQIGDERDDACREHLVHVLDVVGGARDEAPDRVAVEEAEMQRLDVGEDGAPQVAHRGLPGSRHHQRVDVRERGVHGHRREVERGEPEQRRQTGRRLEPVRHACLAARTHQMVEPGLHDPGGRELEQEDGQHEPERERNLRAVGPHVGPQPQQQPPVVRLAESFLLVHRLGSPRARAQASARSCPTLRERVTRFEVRLERLLLREPGVDAAVLDQLSRGCHARRCGPPRAPRSDPPRARC